MTYSFQALHESTHKWLIRKSLGCMFGASLVIRILPSALMQKIDIFGSRAVVQYDL